MKMNMLRSLPDIERVRSLLNHDLENGRLYWIGKRRGRPSLSGDEAGGICREGYRFVVIDGKSYRTHRLIWLLVTGNDSYIHIDHIDGNPLNNKFDNLREATVSQNLCNSRVRSDSTTGIKGISFDGKRNKWRATIQNQGKQFALGRFHRLEDAIAVLNIARDRLHGEFARAA